MEIIGASILASVITTKILATYYFKKVDGGPMSRFSTS